MPKRKIDPIRTVTVPCDCYKCVGQEFEYDEETGRKWVVNNMEHHTFLESCGECGRAKTEYRDLGRKGRYVCWWCNRRAASQTSVNEVLNSIDI